MPFCTAPIRLHFHFAAYCLDRCRFLFVALSFLIGSSAGAQTPCVSLFNQKKPHPVAWNLSNYSEAVNQDWSPWINKTIEVIPVFNSKAERAAVEQKVFGASLPVKQTVLTLETLASKTGQPQFKELLVTLLLSARTDVGVGQEFGFLALNLTSGWRFSKIFRGQRDHNIAIETIAEALDGLIAGVQKDQKIEIILLHNHPTSSPVNGTDLVASQLLLQLLRLNGYLDAKLETIAIGNEARPGFNGPPVFVLELPD